MKRLTQVAILLFLFVLIPVGAEVTFQGLDLDSSGILLFSAKTGSPVFGDYTTLFSSYLKERTVSQLTYFPEEISLLSGGDTIQIQNRYGIFRTDENFANMQPLEGYPSFADGGEIGVGKNPAMAVSPNGRYLVYQKPTTPGSADLYLRDLAGEKEVLLARQVEQRFGNGEISWSKNSEFFIYAKGEKIYYYSVKQYQEERVLPEEYRSLGTGGLRSVFWSDQGDLYLISGTLVFKILGAELFTSTLYRNLLERGTLVGKIPFSFDANFDGFWVSKDGSKILLNKGERNFSSIICRTVIISPRGEKLSACLISTCPAIRESRKFFGPPGIC